MTSMPVRFQYTWPEKRNYFCGLFSVVLAGFRQYKTAKVKKILMWIGQLLIHLKTVGNWTRAEFTETRGVQHWHCLATLPNPGYGSLGKNYTK